MLDTLDSRALRRTDCYGQRFMKPGSYPYNIVPAHGALVSSERPFTVRVREGVIRPGIVQHELAVGTDKGRFRLADPELVIDVGDMVLWNCNERGAQPFAVVGEHTFFNSYRLVNESGYSHAFGTAGDFHWIDAHGSGLEGRVRVKDPGCKCEADLQRWREMVARGTLVTINSGKAEPAEIDIVIGQTVFFLVIKGPGISITDARLAGDAHVECGKDQAASQPSQDAGRKPVKAQ